MSDHWGTCIPCIHDWKSITFISVHQNEQQCIALKPLTTGIYVATRRFFFPKDAVADWAAAVVLRRVADSEAIMHDTRSLVQQHESAGSHEGTTPFRDQLSNGTQDKPPPTSSTGTPNQHFDSTPHEEYEKTSEDPPKPLSPSSKGMNVGMPAAHGISEKSHPPHSKRSKRVVRKTTTKTEVEDITGKASYQNKRLLMNYFHAWVTCCYLYLIISTRLYYRWLMCQAGFSKSRFPISSTLERSLALTQAMLIASRSSSLEIEQGETLLPGECMRKNIYKH